MTRFVISVLLIPLGIFCGLVIQSILRNKGLYESLDTRIRKKFQRIALLVLNPLAILGAIWALPLQNLEIIVLPILEITVILIAGFLSISYTRFKKMPRDRRGSHFCMCYYSNIGSIGGLMTFALLGEPGFMITTFYKMFEEFMSFGIGFPLASRFGKTEDSQKSGFSRIFKDPFVMVSMSAVAFGFLLNFSGLPRPTFYGTLNSFLVPTASLFLLTSIGMSMHLQGMVKHISSSFSVLAIKYLIMPVILTGLAWLFGMGEILDGLPLKALFILGFMPSGFVGVIIPGLYNLDLDYANTAWVMTMLVLIPAVPFMYFGLQHIIPLLITMTPPF